MLVVAGCNPSSEIDVGKNTTVPEEAGTNSAIVVRSDWPLFRGDTNSSGVSQGSVPESPELLWTFTVEGGAFESTAAIVDGIVYVGDLDGTFYAFQLSDGQNLWKFKTEDQVGFTASAAVQGGQVYIGDMDGRFYCLDALSGELIWSFLAGAEINSSANFYQGNVLVGSQDATLYCLDAASGKLVWKHAIEDQIRCAPTVVENRAFLVGCDSKLHLVDLDRGAHESAVGIDSPSGTTPAVHGDFAYFGTHGGTFYCIDWKKGEVAWTYRDSDGQQSYRSSAAVNQHAVIVGGRSRRVYAFDPRTGETQWVFPTQQSVDSSPVIVGKRVFVGSSDGRLYAIDLETGKSDWQFEAGGSIVASPAIANGRVVIANDEGIVFCLG
ncbi:MAG: serine/threonine protein kinase [Planctomycetaceae bacterium]|nr:serine/threonine protein kinase [Planctomycetaceae bacterium]MBP60946.1 serine/threonine protein kinase [Planctomycetaceae bacterium]